MSGNVTARLRSATDRMRDGVASMPSGAKAILGAGVLLVVIGLLIVFTMLMWGRDPKTDTNAYRGYLVDTGGQDLPAPTFTGWVSQQREEPLTVVEPDEGIVEVSPAVCAPGGDLHRAAQEVTHGWAPAWSGETLSLVAYNAQMDIDIANPERLPLRQIDEWTSACPRTTFSKDGIEHVQKVQVLPVEGDYWGMDDNRVHVVTLTRLQDGRNLGTTTTLYAVSQHRELTMRGALTIRGSVTDDAISTLNLLWERQTMKVLAEHNK